MRRTCKQRPNSARIECRQLRAGHDGALVDFPAVVLRDLLALILTHLVLYLSIDPLFPPLLQISCTVRLARMRIGMIAFAPKVLDVENLPAPQGRSLMWAGHLQKPQDVRCLHVSRCAS